MNVGQLASLEANFYTSSRSLENPTDEYILAGPGHNSFSSEIFKLYLHFGVPETFFKGPISKGMTVDLTPIPDEI